MPKFLAVTDFYKPIEYSLGDFKKYQLLLNVQELPNRDPSRSIVLSNKPATKQVASASEMISSIVNKMRLLPTNSAATYPNSDYFLFITRYTSSNQFEDLGNYLRDTVTLDNCNPAFIKLHQSLLEMVVFIYEIDANVDKNPAELGPVAKSLEYLEDAWENLTGIRDSFVNVGKQIPEKFIGLLRSRDKVTEEIVAAHIANLQMVLDSGYAEACRQEFVEGRQGLEAKLNAIPRLPTETSPTTSNIPATHPRPNPTAVAPINAGLLIRIYRDPRFSNWFTQLLLLAIVIGAAMVAAGLTLPALLPVAVAAVVKSMSILATRIMTGAAITAGTAAAATLATSLYARFFSNPRETGSGQQPSLNKTPPSLLPRR